MDDLKVTVGKNIKKLRQCSKETIVELSEVIGVRHSTVSDWENGKKMPRTTAIQKIAEHYNVLMSDIVSDTCESDRSKEIKSNDIIDLKSLLLSETRVIFDDRVLSTQEKLILERLVKAVILQ